ncbi:hypothetical protein [Mucilaginibacter sp. PAMB04168]|uniref:hypothetical protein n=1 Tax=Mucilaginibacter sp. PAMB04168 TaxID=3138567 RepID=UPI0031F69654
MPYYEFPCPVCHVNTNISESVCAACGHPFAQTVNIRRALLKTEVFTLEKRYKEAKETLTNRSLTSEGDFLENEVLVKGKAVINLDFPFLWDWLMHRDRSYQSYRRIVIEGLRQRADFENDLQRSIVESYLFGSHIDIIYAALSLNESGLISYGKVSIILKTKAIEPRTSLLEKNSYVFVDEAVAQGWNHKMPLPPGSMAPWRNRHQLALVKCQDRVVPGLTSDQAASIILYSDGNRANDDFMELYIYGNIVKAVVEKIKIPLSLKKGFNEKVLAQYEELKTKFIVEEY